MELMLAFGLAFAFTLGLTPIVRAAARASGRVAQPTADRWHKRPTALFGGVGMFAGFLAGAAALYWGARGGDHAAHLVTREVVGIVVAASLMFATGLVDDLRKLRPTSKLVLQALAGVVLVTVGVHYVLTPWTPVNVIFTLFWFIALTNALNLLDNMDGVTTGVAGVSGLFLACLFAFSGQWLFVILSLALAGAAFGFLPYNMRPASIFMGDAGSLFHGAMLAGLGAAYTMVGPTGYAAAALAPMLIVIVPILDTGLVTFTRTLAGLPITQGGRDHVAHRLVRMGVRESRAALLLSLVAAGGGLFALVLARNPGPASMWMGATYVVALLVCGGYLSQLHSYPMEAARARRPARVVLEELFYRRRLLEVLLDLVVFAIAYTGAYLLRYDGSLPASQTLLLEGSLALAVGCKSVAFLMTGVYRGVWSQASIPDVHRLVRGTLLGSLLTMAAIVFLFRDAQFARSIFVLDGILVALLVLALRASFRSLEAVRYSLNGVGSRTLVYGAGKAGEVVLRELFSNPEPHLHPVGFIDDEPAKMGRWIHGLPVLGREHQLAERLAQHRIEKLIISTQKLPPDRIDRIFGICQQAGVEVLQLHLEIAPAKRSQERTGKRDPRGLASREVKRPLEVSGTRG